MAWTPISLAVLQYQNPSTNAPASGYVLKAYEAGTSTNTPMATDSGGLTQFNDVQLDSSGFPSHSGSIVIPHIDRDYKLALFATQAAADADTPAVWEIDNLSQVNVAGDITTEDTNNTGSTAVQSLTHTTSLVPGVGIGTGQSYITETSDGNNEIGMVLESVSTNVGAGTETFDFVVRLMAAGATAAEKFRITSAGQIKPVSIDVNGGEIILDPDGDTSITADTDDQIDFRIGGVDALSLTATKADNLDDIAALTPTDSNFIVGDGTDWVAENATTARTSLGVGTGDTPTFAGINLGNENLSNYDEGTFTPVLSDGTNDATASSATGTYTRIGNTCTITINLQISSLGSVSGDTRITGLPFNAANSNAVFAAGDCRNLSITAGEVICGQSNSGFSFMTLHLWDATTGATALQHSEITASGILRLAGTYLIS